MYRKRDSGSRGYSSADAYRSLQKPVSPTSSNSHAAHSSSSEEEAQLTMRRVESPGPYPESSVDNNHAGDSTPLDPPRPFFLAGNRKNSSASDRGSWSSVTESVDPASDSDRDNEAAAALVGAAQPGARRVRANTAGSTSAASTSMRPRNHHRRRSSSVNPPASPPNPFDTPTMTPPTLNRAPPSAFPFLSHAGNPDPGTPLPTGIARRPSRESFRRNSIPNTPVTATGVAYPSGAGAGGYAALGPGERTSIDVADGYSYAPVNANDHDELGRPHAPFMGDADRASWAPNNAGSVYRNSAAGAMSGSTAALAGDGTLPRTNSQPTIAMRAPFLSPASRPTSSLWSPPSYPSLPQQQHLTSQYPPSLSYLPNSPYGSGVSPYKPKFGKAPMPSSRLANKLSKEDKPWIGKKDKRERWAYWLTLAMVVIGFACAALVIYLGWVGVRQLKDSDVCLVLDDNFNSLDLSNTWTRDIELGGFGNGEFQMATDLDKNSFIKNGQLYIRPTLTSDDIGEDKVLDGGQYTLDNCPGTGNEDLSGTANCSASSDASQHKVIPPVQSARLHTRGHYSIQYGRVEVRAKLPRGDWLWPAIWMLPVDNKYGPWPMSGEIDIMEARGNGPTYGAQGDNFVRSTLNYGPFEALQTHIIGWYQQKRFTYADDFHTYAIEWSPSFVRTYIDSRLQATLTVDITGKGGHSFFDRGHYPATAHNGSDTEVVVTNIWDAAGGSPAAPFDQQFYLILDLAVGGTSGWFPDGVGDKPWFDTSGNDVAMQDFAQAQKIWSATWPSNEDDVSFRIDSVKMWKLKSNGKC